MGLNAIKYNKRTQRFERSNIAFLYNLGVTVTMVTIFVYNLKDVKLWQKNSDSISQATSWFEAFSGTSILTFGTLLHLFNMKKIVVFLHEFVDVDNKIKMLGIDINHGNVVKLTVWGLVFVLLEFSIVFLSDYFFFVDNESKLYLFASYFPLLTNGTMKLQYIVSVYLIKTRFEVLNLFLLKIRREIVVGFPESNREASKKRKCDILWQIYDLNQICFRIFDVSKTFGAFFV